MKKTIVIVMALALLVGVVSAQNARVRIDTYPMGPGGRVYASATQQGDSVKFSIPYDGSGVYSQILTRGQYPDSVKIAVFGVSDSMGMDIDIGSYGGAATSYWNPYFKIDSLSTLGTKGAYRATVLNATNWFGYDQMTIAVKSRALGAAGRAKTPTRAWVRIERYFIVPPK